MKWEVGVAVPATVSIISKKNNETRKWSYGKANIAEVAYWNLTMHITSMFGRIMDILEVGIDAPKHRSDVYS